MFVTEKEVDGVMVVVWEHHSLEQAIRGRYLSDPDEVTAVHSLLADYFLGTWAGRPKPLDLPKDRSHTIQSQPHLERGAAIPPCGNPADRLVPSQPLAFPAEPGDTEVGLPLIVLCPIHI
jgi:hypothetical protein